jgi:4'-phosphopantetheinyl transferase
MSVRWHRAHLDEVPDGDEWLTGAEPGVVSRLFIPKRRADWRLGRWTAKTLLATVLDVPADRIEIRAAGDGAPEAFADGVPVGLSLSLSHRDGVAVAAVAPLPTTVGIDLETIEPRSDAFVREWLSGAEQAGLPEAGPARDLQVLTCWTGKEASAKVLRKGLRLDVRHAVVDCCSSRSGWAPLTVTWHTEEVVHHGWWRREAGTAIAVATDPASDPPVRVAR